MAIPITDKAISSYGKLNLVSYKRKPSKRNSLGGFNITRLVVN